MAGKRPGGVTLIAVMVWIQGALDILAGLVLLISLSVAGTADAFGGAAGLVTIAIGYILFGLIVILVARGLIRGSSGARLIVTVVEVITVVGAVFLLIASPVQGLSALGSGFVALLVILLLWTGRAAQFFRRTPARIIQG